MILKIKSYCFFGLLATLVLAAWLFVIKENRTNAFAEKLHIPSEDIPFIDRMAPAETETATFALG